MVYRMHNPDDNDPGCTGCTVAICAAVLIVFFVAWLLGAITNAT